MNIGGLQPFSLNDFPGRVAAVVFTQGCNFRCPFCHNGQLLACNPTPGKLLAEADILGFLKARRKQLDGVVVSGGEPTLHADLPQFLRALHELDYAIKLDTNGSHPDMIRELLDDRLVDYVAMDVKAPLERYETLAGVTVDTANIVESIRLITTRNIAHQFRTTVIPALHTDADIDEIRRLLPADEELRLQTFRPEHALDPTLREAGVTETTAALAG